MGLVIQNIFLFSYMESLIETFHIDIKLLLAQIINFTIVFFVLFFFVLKPLIKVMQERTKKIEKSIKDTEKIEKRLANTEDEYNKRIFEAKKQANAIIKKTYIQAEEKGSQIIIKAKQEISKIIDKEKVKMRIKKNRILKEIKNEVADLIVACLEKVLEEKVDEKKDGELVKRVVKSLDGQMTVE